MREKLMSLTEKGKSLDNFLDFETFPLCISITLSFFPYISFYLFIYIFLSRFLSHKNPWDYRYLTYPTRSAVI